MPDNLPAQPESGVPPDYDVQPMEAFDILTQAGLPARNAFRLIKIIEEMASANLIHRFELKLEAQNAKLEAHNAKLEAQNATLEAQNSKFNLLLWFIGLGTAILATFIAAF